MKNRNFDGANIWRAHFEGEIPEDIHPEDFAVALRAKLLASPYPREFADAALLDSLCAKPGEPWTEEQLRTIGSKKDNPNFFLALSRGLENKRKPTFNAVEMAILMGWREIKLFEQSLPGLRNWSPRAATCFLQAKEILSAQANHKATFADTRKALGFKPGNIIVSGFAVEDFDAKRQVTS